MYLTRVHSQCFETLLCSSPETSVAQHCGGNGNGACGEENCTLRLTVIGRRVNVTSECAARAWLYFERVPYLVVRRVRAGVYCGVGVSL